MRLSSSKPVPRDELQLIASNIYKLTRNEFEVVADIGLTGIEVNTERKINSSVYIDILKSGLYAGITLLPPINSDTYIELDEIMNKIRSGYHIENEFLDIVTLQTAYQHYRNNTIVFREIIADGKPAIKGTNALIKLFFDVSLSKPIVLANGKVDYKNSTNYIFAKQGDILIQRIPPTEGKNGISVTGVELLAAPGLDRVITPMTGVHVNEDKTEYKALISGQIVFNNSTLSINPFLDIKGNVDYKSGNVKFLGTVNVSGDVFSGFSIEAEDIIIQGICEDATLTAKNSINIKTGIKGKSKGVITAGTDVLANYLENAKIIADGSVEIVKYCYNSDITANNIVATGRDCIIGGGKLDAFDNMTLINVGSKSSQDTQLSVGLSAKNIAKLKAIDTELKTITESLTKMKVALSQVDLKDRSVIENPKIKKIIEAIALLKNRLPILTEKRKEFEANIRAVSPSIIINGTIQPGVKVTFFETTIAISSEMKRIKFTYNSMKNEILFTKID